MEFNKKADWGNTTLPHKLAAELQRMDNGLQDLFDKGAALTTIPSTADLDDLLTYQFNEGTLYEITTSATVGDLPAGNYLVTYHEGSGGSPATLLFVSLRHGRAYSHYLSAGFEPRIESVSIDPTIAYEYYKQTDLDNILGELGELTVPEWRKYSTAIFFGDSLTEVNGHYTKGYYSHIAETLRLHNISNKGVSGYTLADIYESVYKCSITSGLPNLVCVMGGVNDVTYSVPLGNIDDQDTSTTYGSLNCLCALLKQKFPTSTILFITPHFQTKYVHDDGITTYEISEAIKHVCKKYAIPVYDNYSNSGIFETNLAEYTTDNCHWNDYAHRCVGKAIGKYILNNFPARPAANKLDKSTDWVGKTVVVNKNYNDDDNKCHLTALIAVDEDIVNGAVVSVQMSGINSHNMIAKTTSGGPIYSDNTGTLNNAKYGTQLTNVVQFVQTVSANNEVTFTVPDRTITTDVTTPYIKVPIMISGNASYSFEISELSICVDGKSKEILDLGAFFKSDREIITVLDISHVSQSVPGYLVESGVDTDRFPKGTSFDNLLEVLATELPVKRFEAGGSPSSIKTMLDSWKDGDYIAVYSFGETLVGVFLVINCAGKLYQVCIYAADNWASSIGTQSNSYRAYNNSGWGSWYGSNIGVMLPRGTNYTGSSLSNVLLQISNERNSDMDYLDGLISKDSGTFGDGETAWYTDEQLSSHKDWPYSITNGTYEKFGNYCTISATIEKVDGWTDVFYSIPVAAKNIVSTVAVDNAGIPHIISTDTIQTAPVIKLSRLDRGNQSRGQAYDSEGNLIDDSTVTFTLTYQYR